MMKSIRSTVVIGAAAVGVLLAPAVPAFAAADLDIAQLEASTSRSTASAARRSTNAR